MDQLYAWKLDEDGLLRARLWYVRHALFFPLRLAGESVLGAPGSAARGVGRLARHSRYSLRRLRKSPSYAWTAVLIMGLGVGGIATVFNAANWVALRPVPGVGDRSELVTVRLELERPSSPAFPLSAPDLSDLGSAAAPSLERLAGASERDVNVLPIAGGDPRRLTAALVSPNYFWTLSSRPALGRLLSHFDAESGANVVVVSHRLWAGAWGGLPSVVGQTILVNDAPFLVVGVAPPGFHGAELPGSQDLWLPAGALPLIDPDAPHDALEQRGYTLFDQLVGRTAEGVTPERVSAQLTSGMEAIRGEHVAHSFNGPFRLRVYPGVGLSPRVRNGVHRTLALMAGAAALLLLLAIANVGNLGLARTLSEGNRHGVRRALGASRMDIAAGVVADHALLGLHGAAVSLLLATVATSFLGRARLSSLGASLAGIHLDGRVVGFTILVGLLATIVAGIIPALAGSRQSLVASLHSQRQGERTGVRSQTLLAAAQVALSMVLVVTGGLLVRSASNLQNVDPGFETAGAIRFAIDPFAERGAGDGVGPMLATIRADLEGRAGVSAVGFAARTPIDVHYLAYPIWPAGRPREEAPIVAAQLDVTDGFLEAMGARLLAGRGFRAADVAPRHDPDEEPVILTEGLAREMYPGRSAPAIVGQTFDGVRQRLRIVGVVRDIRLTGAASDAPPAVFLPLRNHGPGPITGWVRGTAPTAQLVEQVGDAVRRLDPALPVYDVRTVSAQLDRLIVEQRVVRTLALGLAAVALLLAAVGLNGLLWYAVTHRRREIGIRMALGATPGRVARTMVRSGVIATAIGSAAGLLGSVAASRVVEARLFEVERLDPVSFAGGIALIVFAAAAASWAPARQASRIAPREILTE